MAHCLLRAQPVQLTNGQQAQVNCLYTLCLESQIIVLLKDSHLMRFMTHLISFIWQLKSKLFGIYYSCNDHSLDGQDK